MVQGLQRLGRGHSVCGGTPLPLVLKLSYFVFHRETRRLHSLYLFSSKEGACLLLTQQIQISSKTTQSFQIFFNIKPKIFKLFSMKCQTFSHFCQVKWRSFLVPKRFSSDSILMHLGPLSRHQFIDPFRLKSCIPNVGRDHGEGGVSFMLYVRSRSQGYVKNVSKC